MAKEKSEKQNMWPYLAIVGIVAIVAVVVLVMNFSGKDSEESTLIVNEEGNLAGEAATSTIIRPSGTSKSTCVDLEPMNDHYIEGTVLINQYNKVGSRWILDMSYREQDGCLCYLDPNTEKYKISRLSIDTTCTSSGTNPVQYLYRECIMGCDGVIKYVTEKDRESNYNLVVGDPYFSGRNRCKGGGYNSITKERADQIIAELESS